MCVRRFDVKNESAFVSIVCCVYNEEAYIAEALESFLSQKTTFNYEIIIYDDASTDGSADIIRKYTAKYPDMVNPILMEKNQFQQFDKQININDQYIRPHCWGKYIALCEGDDYWCDESKLEKMVSFLEAHPDYSGAVHNTRMIDEEKRTKGFCWQGDKDADIVNTDDFLSFPHTSSFVYRNPWTTNDPALKKIAEPLFSRDKSIALYMLQRGKVRYFKDVMSCYRRVNKQGASISALTKSQNMTLWNVNQELALYRQIRAYQMDIDLKYHYFRNVLDYARKRAKQEPSETNKQWVKYAYEKCPWSRAEYYLYLAKQKIPKGVKETIKGQRHRA